MSFQALGCLFKLKYLAQYPILAAVVLNCSFIGYMDSIWAYPSGKSVPVEKFEVPGPLQVPT